MHEALFRAADTFISAHEAKVAQLEQLDKMIEKKKKDAANVANKLNLFERSRVFLQALAEEAREEVAAGLRDVVTMALQLSFGDKYWFEIVIKTHRNKPSITFLACQDLGEAGILKVEPEDSKGGGLVDVVAIGLRYGLLKVLNPYPIGSFIFDEPAKMVSGNLVDLVASLLKEMSRIFNKQSIVVTHHEAFQYFADRTIRVRRGEDGISHCEIA